MHAVGPGKVAYQVTMAGTQDVREAGLQQAVRLLGASPEDRIPLRLCLLAPQDTYQTWKKKRCIVVPEGLVDRVRVYAVMIDAK
jgi:hypothetical protein